jgi:hypothetical protein
MKQGRHRYYRPCGSLWALSLTPLHIDWHKADITAGLADVRFGSKADIEAVQSDVRFTPESGH